jgi:hypothetical protein
VFESVFEFFISAGQAYNQVGMFIGAIVCLGLGGLILGNSLYWRIHALRASGTIIGVINRAAHTPPSTDMRCRTGKPMWPNRIPARARFAAKRPDVSLP